MSHWQDRFLGTKDIPPELSPLELEFFQYLPKDIAAIKAAFRPKYRIAVAVQLGFMRLTGSRLNIIKVFPRDLLKIIGDQFGETPPSIASLRSMYLRRPTRSEHQSWVMNWLKIKAHSKRQERMLLAAMRDASKGTTSIDRLIAMARQWLFDKSLLVPAESTLRDICVRASNDTEESIYTAICQAVSSKQRIAWAEGLMKPRKDGSTHLEWLQRPPKKRSHKTRNDLFEKIDYLTKLGVADVDLSSIPMDRLKTYALKLQHRRPSHFSSLAERNQTLYVMSFLHVVLSQVTDAAIHLAGKLTSDVVSNASQQVKKAQGATLKEYRELIQTMIGKAEDSSISDESFRTQCKSILNEFAPKVFPSHAAAVRALLTNNPPSIRPLLQKLSNLQIEGLPTDRATQNLKILKSLYKAQKTTLPEGNYDCTSVWTKLVNDEPDRARALNALEMSTLSELRRGFRRASCWIDSSASYRDREQMLIPQQQWALQRRRHLAMLRMPEKPDKVIADLTKAVEKGLNNVAGAVALGDVTIENGEISLPKVIAETLPPGVQEARDAITKEIGTIQMPELILEMDAKTRFSKTLLGRAPESERELLLIYGALFAHGTEMNAHRVSLMMPSLKAEEISATMKSLEYDDVIGKANQLLVQFIGRLPVTQHWGDGKSASSDMMSLPTSRHLWNARLDPRRKTSSIGMYTHVHDRWPIIHNQPIVLGERQVGAAIEGVVRQHEIELARLAVDTHGYSDAGMCISWMQSFALCPRLKDLTERRLTIPKGMAIPDALKLVVDATLNPDCVSDEHWDELLRIAASISNGTVSAVLILQRYGSAAQGDPIYRAAKTIGRLLRTIYLCDYFTKPDFRREIHRILNRGESVHTLQRAIHFGEIDHDRGRRFEELNSISGSLTLLTNLVIGWTALKTQEALDTLALRGVTIASEVLRHISPSRYGHVNFRGTFKFPMEQYWNRLFGENITKQEQPRRA